MTIEDQNSYYSRHFDIICIQDEWDDLNDSPLYSLEVSKEEHIIDRVTKLTEEQLPDELEKLKTKTYLSI